VGKIVAVRSVVTVTELYFYQFESTLHKEEEMHHAEDVQPHVHKKMWKFLSFKNRDAVAKDAKDSPMFC